MEPSTINTAEKPSILILGAVGMIGRNFVTYLVENNLCSRIRAVDKQLPVVAFLTRRQQAAFDNPIVTCVQADLTKDQHIIRAFGEEHIDIVVNLAAETKFGQANSIYEQRCTRLSVACGSKALEKGIRRFVEVSTAAVYKSQSRHPSREDAVKEPWTRQAEAKLTAENHLLSMEGLNLVILRPSCVYGPGDFNSLMPRAVCAASYQHLHETMKFLWDASLKLNTVHVLDVCRAIFHVATNTSIPSRSIFNLSDKTDSDQGVVNAHFGGLFDVKTAFVGGILSNFARLNMAEVVEGANEKHLRPWTDLCHLHAVTSTNLSPFLSLELLENRHMYVDGSAIERTGFVYQHPTVTRELLKEMIADAIRIGTFPPVMIGGPTRREDDGDGAQQQQEAKT